MKIKKLTIASLSVLSLFLMGAQGGCDEPPRYNRTSSLTVSTNVDGSSSFTFTMTSNARNTKEAIEQAISSLTERARVEAEAPAPAVK